MLSDHDDKPTRQRTAQACNKCRERKTKVSVIYSSSLSLLIVQCSGHRPVCTRCTHRGLVCEYSQRESRRPKSAPTQSLVTRQPAAPQPKRWHASPSPYTLRPAADSPRPTTTPSELDYALQPQRTPSYTDRYVQQSYSMPIVRNDPIYDPDQSLFWPSTSDQQSTYPMPSFALDMSTSYDYSNGYDVRVASASSQQHYPQQQYHHYGPQQHPQQCDQQQYQYLSQSYSSHQNVRLVRPAPVMPISTQALESTAAYFAHDHGLVLRN